MVLEYFESEEDFMVCKMMIDTIDEHNKISKGKLPTRLQDHLFDEVVFDYSKLGFNVSRDKIFERQKDYANVLIIDLTK
jgi:hypothetical protein